MSKSPSTEVGEWASGHQRQQRLAGQGDNVGLVTVDDHVDDQAIDALVEHVLLQAFGHLLGRAEENPAESLRRYQSRTDRAASSDSVSMTEAR